MNEVSTSPQALLDLIDKYNNIDANFTSTFRMELSSSGVIQVVLNDGGYTGSTYVGRFAHGLGYTPMFLAYGGDSASGQYRLLPEIPMFDGAGATIPEELYAYADTTYLYIAWYFYAAKVSFGVTNTGPFYSAGTSRNFPFFVLKNPIVTN